MFEQMTNVGNHDFYCIFLAVNILCNDLPSARHLWRRIPESVRDSSIELGYLWDITRALWRRDMDSTYRSLDREWPDFLKQIIGDLKEFTIDAEYKRISNAYSCVTTETLRRSGNLKSMEEIKARK